MWCLMVFNVIALIQSAQGGYEYPKPSIPFELPNQALQDIAGGISKENKIDHKAITYSLPHEGYQYLQKHNNEESRHTIGSTDESVQQNLELGINQLNANIDIHSDVSQNSEVKESSSINVQPLNSANCPQLILNIKNKQPPLFNLLNSQYTQHIEENSNEELLNIQNFAHILEAKNNVPLLIKLIANNQVSSVNENILSQPINIPDIEQQLNDHSSDVQHLQPSLPQNVNNVIETIESPIINLRESVPQVLNPQNNIQTTSISGDLNFGEHVSSVQDNQIFLSNLNDEQVQRLNFQISQAAITRELLSLQNTRQNIATPVITKSISFHVPPPDIEETPVVPTVLPPKKTYKIIFIKVPTYEYLYNQQLQNSLYSRLAPVEDKTIIYVLTKKPEVLPEQVFLPQPTKVSEHEVLYVQYKGGQKINAGQEVINESISQLPLNSAFDTTIEPRSLNGH